MTKLERRNIHTYPFKYTYTPAKEFFEADEAALYVHVPFCQRKCHFCDYAATTGSTEQMRERYVSSVCKEIEQFEQLPCFPAFRVDALYIGGGTPSLLDADQLIRILQTCRSNFSFKDDVEIAVEFDPETATPAKIAALREAGFNRISIGVQTFSERLLRDNNRPHGVKAITDALSAARDAGFNHTNIDLLYPLIGQTMDDWQDTVRQALVLKPAAITAYPLEIWPTTTYDILMKKKDTSLPSFETELEMGRFVANELEGAGYRRGSTTGYYDPERVARYCRFQDYYWKSWPMIGFGVSAKSVIYSRCYTNVSSLEEYIRRMDCGDSAIDFSTRMTKEQEMRRVMIRGLKTCEVRRSEFRERFGVDMVLVFGLELERMVASGWARMDDDKLELTREGQLYDRSVYAMFYTVDDLRPPREGERQYGLSDAH